MVYSESWTSWRLERTGALVGVFVGCPTAVIETGGLAATAQPRLEIYGQQSVPAFVTYVDLQILILVR